MTISQDHLAPLLNAYAAGSNAEVFAAASTACAAAIGHDLLTIMRFDPSAWEVERLYSTRPDIYPPGGRKPKRSTPWGQHVLADGKPFLGSGAEAMRWAFDDADTILGMGLAHVINMPIRAEGRTLGTINLLRAAPAFGEDDAVMLGVVANLLAGILAPGPESPDADAASC